MPNRPTITTFQAGSRTALPIGRESQFLYNGLTINDLVSSVEQYRITSLDGFDDADVVDARDKLPSQWGEAPHLPQHGGRTMTIAGNVIAGNTLRLRDMEAALRTAFALPYTNTEMPLQIQMGHAQAPVPPAVQINCRKLDKVLIKQLDTPNEYKSSFQISLRASNPRYLGLTQKTLTIVPTVVTQMARVYNRTYNLVYQTTIDSTGHPAQSSNTGTAVNLGNIRAQPIIQFNGPMSGAVLTNAVNGQQLRVPSQISSGNYVSVNILTGGVFDSLGNIVGSMVDPGSDDFELEGNTLANPGGNNLITLDVATFGTGASVQLSWFDTYW